MSVTEGLTTEVILERIFKFLPTNELIKVTRVRQLWLVEALTTIRNRGDNDSIKILFIAKSVMLPPNFWRTCHERWIWAWMSILELEREGVVIDRESFFENMEDINTCTEIQEFVQYLQVSRSRSPTAKPFCGIYLKIVGLHGDSCPPAVLLDKSPAGNGHLHARILTVNLGQCWDQHNDCPTFVDLKELLSTDQSYIEEFSLLVSCKRNRFHNSLLRGYTFEKLDTLTFRDVDWYTAREAYTNFIKKLVSRAPKLEYIYTHGWVDLNVNLLEGLREKSQAKHLTRYPYSPSLDEIPETAVDSLLVIEMKLQGIGEDFSLERFDRITVKLLQESSSTLRLMTIDLPFLLPLMAYSKNGISLKILSSLQIVLDPDCFTEAENQNAWNMIKAFDFNRIFPKLSTVFIKVDWESHLRQKKVLDAFISKLSLLEGDNVTPDRAVNIKYLQLDLSMGADLRESCIDYLVQMFPNYQCLWIQLPYDIISLGGIWGSLPNLKQLHITFTGDEHDPSINLDSVLCGIHPNKVAELRDTNDEVAKLRKTEDKDEYLKAVKIVPVMPSIADLENLEYIAIVLQSNYGGLHFVAENPSSLFPKVMPLRSITKAKIFMGTRDKYIPEALSHLQPYLSGFVGG